MCSLNNVLKNNGFTMVSLKHVEQPVVLQAQKPETLKYEKGMLDVIRE